MLLFWDSAVVLVLIQNSKYVILLLIFIMSIDIHFCMVDCEGNNAWNYQWFVLQWLECSSTFWYRFSNEARVLLIYIENVYIWNWYTRLCILWNYVKHALWAQLFSKYCSKVKFSVILYTWEYSHLCTLFVRCMSSYDYGIQIYSSMLWTCNVAHLFI